MRLLKPIAAALWAFLAVGLSSCATLLNSKDQAVGIYTTKDLRFVKADSARQTHHLAGSPDHYITRSPQHVRLYFNVGDSLPVFYDLESRLSVQYVLFNSCSPLCAGYFIDLFSPKSYAYPRRNYFSYDARQNELIHSSTRPYNKGELKIGLGWNAINGYHTSLVDGSFGKSSPAGLGIFADYFSSPRHSFFFEMGRATSIDLVKRRAYGLKKPLDSVLWDRIGNTWLVLGSRYHIKRFNAGAGLCLGAFSWQGNKEVYVFHDTVVLGSKGPDTLTNFSLSRSETIRRHPLKLGLCISLGCKPGEHWRAGFNWQCYFADVNTRQAYASHFFNAYIAFDILEINLKRKKDPYAGSRP